VSETRLHCPFPLPATLFTVAHAICTEQAPLGEKKKRRERGFICDCPLIPTRYSTPRSVASIRDNEGKFRESENRPARNRRTRCDTIRLQLRKRRVTTRGPLRETRAARLRNARPSCVPIYNSLVSRAFSDARPTFFQ
jgi:hypothetical protein